MLKVVVPRVASRTDGSKERCPVDEPTITVSMLPPAAARYSSHITFASEL